MRVARNIIFRCVLLAQLDASVASSRGRWQTPLEQSIQIPIRIEDSPLLTAPLISFFGPIVSLEKGKLCIQFYTSVCYLFSFFALCLRNLASLKTIVFIFKAANLRL